MSRITACTAVVALLALACQDVTPPEQRGAPESVVPTIGGPPKVGPGTAGPPLSALKRSLPAWSASDPEITESTFSAQVGSPVSDPKVFDVIWQDTLTGDRVIALSRGVSLTPIQIVPLGNVPLEWEVVASADFDRDGQSDILWRNRTSGEIGTWLLANDFSIKGWVSWGLVPSEWTTRGVADMDGNQSADIIWWNTSTHERGVWLLNLTTLSGWHSWGAVGPEWQLLGACDAWGTADQDLVWYRPVERDVWIWEMAALSIAGVRTTGVIPTYVGTVLPVLGTTHLNVASVAVSRCGGMILRNDFPGWRVGLIDEAETSDPLIFYYGLEQGSWRPAAASRFHRTEGEVSTIVVAGSPSLRAGIDVQLSVQSMTDVRGLPVNVAGRSVVFLNRDPQNDSSAIIHPDGRAVFPRASTGWPIAVLVDGRLYNLTGTIRPQDDPTSISLHPNVLTLPRNPSTSSETCYDGPAFAIRRADGALARRASAATSSAAGARHTWWTDGVNSLQSNRGDFATCLAANGAAGTRSGTVSAAAALTPLSVPITVHILDAPKVAPTLALDITSATTTATSVNATIGTTVGATGYEVYVQHCPEATVPAPQPFGSRCFWIPVPPIVTTTPTANIPLEAAGTYRIRVRALHGTEPPSLLSTYRYIVRQ